MLDTSSLREHLVDSLLFERSAAFAQIDSDFTINETQGSFERFGLKTPLVGANANKELPFIEGLLPVTKSLRLPQVQFNDNTYADLHLVPCDQGAWIMLLEVSEEANLQQKMQQALMEAELTKGSQLTDTRLVQNLVTKLDLVVFSYEQGALRPLNKVPAWLTKLYPETRAESWLVDDCSFLGNFLIDAVE